MAVPVFVVGAVVAAVGAAVAWLDRRGVRVMSPTPCPLQARVPVEVVQAIVALRSHNATPAQMRRAAAGATAAGQPRLGLALLEQATLAEQTAKLAAPVAAMLHDVSYPSPLPQVTDEAWNTYARRARVARPSTHSEWNRFGMYAMTARMLSDIGLMVEAHKGDFQGRRAVWIGTWADGMSAASFLASPQAQHDALAALVRLHARVIEGRHASTIGTTLEGQMVTLSGLLAVAQKAGLGGLAKWLADANDRAGFPETTAAYTRLNGIF